MPVQKDFTERVQSVRSGIRKLEEIAVSHRVRVNDILSKKFSSNVSNGNNSQGEYLLQTSRRQGPGNDHEIIGESPETIPLPLLTAEKTTSKLAFRLNLIGDETSMKSNRDLSKTGSHSTTPPLRGMAGGSSSDQNHISLKLKQARILDDAIPEHLSQQEASGFQS
eukprot:CAMPEP_0170512252 /NCGR_PEP_ID=MMETSP0208-20121228/66749_1 /TAXON_ID=197538 /ORGANISM="Strombidium inclinatum, Strain S3" /LENGTH=165 /DNA_ID=CAMNT_0010795867 /DNA_START=1523 /DNA_END=2020 /DNA_ORIENTATION=-